MTVTALSIARALNASLRKMLEDDPKVLVTAKDVGRLGGVFRITEDLQKDFGEDRIMDTPLAESGIVGTAIGLALRGYRPVVEIQFDGFLFPAYNQMVTQLRQDACPLARQGQAADGHPDPLRRRNRRDRAPQRVA